MNDPRMQQGNHKSQVDGEEIYSWADGEGSFAER